MKVKVVIREEEKGGYWASPLARRQGVSARCCYTKFSRLF
jgi:hypothetical protein